MDGNSISSGEVARTTSRVYTCHEKAQWVERFSESGLSLRRFSQQHGLRCMSLWRWVQQSRRQDSERAFFTEVELPAVAGAPAASWSMELIRANGSVLRLNGNVPVAILEQLLRVC